MDPRLRKEVLSVQFVWFLCHFVVILFSFLHVVAYITGFLSSQFTYGVTLKAAIVGFAIILYKLHPVRFQFLVFIDWRFFLQPLSSGRFDK